MHRPINKVTIKNKFQFDVQYRERLMGNLPVWPLRSWSHKCTQKDISCFKPRIVATSVNIKRLSTEELQPNIFFKYRTLYCSVLKYIYKLNLLNQVIFNIFTAKVYLDQYAKQRITKNAFKKYLRNKTRTKDSW